MQRPITLCVLAASLACVAPAHADWLQFRGTRGDANAGNADLPTDWNDGRNIAWKIPIPGRGASSPIVVDGRVVLTCSSGIRQDRLHVVCYSAKTGRLLWHRQIWATGHTSSHPTSPTAAPTPASDGESIFAFYSSNDLVCFDLDGNLKWFRGMAFDFPKARNDVGMASSPTVIGRTVVVQIENQNDSFAEGIDTQTGRTRWHLDRVPSAVWCSPVAVAGKDAALDAVLLQSHEGITAVGALTGRSLWFYETQCSGIPSPVRLGEVLLVPSNGLTALQLPDATVGPVLDWDEIRLRPGSPSPAVADGRVYSLAGGIVSCGDVATGHVHWKVRLKGRFWATPVVAAGHLYCFNYDGLAHVVRIGDDPKVVATMEMGEIIQGTPAVSDDAMFVRSDGHLWKIAKPKRL